MVCFHVLAVINSAAMNIGVHVSFQSMVFYGYMSRIGIAGSYGNSMFNILRSCQTYSPKKNFFFQVGKKMWLRLGGIEIELIEISSW